MAAPRSRFASYQAADREGHAARNPCPFAKARKGRQAGNGKRLRGIIGAVFRLAIATLRATTDPTYALRGALAAPVVRHRPAITDERQLGALLGQIDEYTGWPTLKAALQFLALTMARPIEVRHMLRNEVIWPSAIWRIPAERMKMRRPHDVPLSKQALEVLRGGMAADERRQSRVSF